MTLYSRTYLAHISSKTSRAVRTAAIRVRKATDSVLQDPTHEVAALCVPSQTSAKQKASQFASRSLI